MDLSEYHLSEAGVISTTEYEDAARTTIRKIDTQDNISRDRYSRILSYDLVSTVYYPEGEESTYFSVELSDYQFDQAGRISTKEYEDAASYGGLNIKHTLTWARCAARAASITATVNGDQAQASTNYFIDAGLRMLDRAAELGAFKEDGVREQLLAEQELAILRTHPRFAASVGEAASDDATE